MNLFESLPSETRRELNAAAALIDKTFPLPRRFRAALPAGVAELSRLLTSGRGERRLSYLGQPNMLSAYLRYFLPWNLYRLCRLLPALDISLAAGDLVVDLGAGPLTFTAALWISRPDLRSLPLEFRCIDLSGPALEAGKSFFAALAGGASPWKIQTLKGPAGGRRREKFLGPDSFTGGRPASLVCAVNVLNEMYSGIPHGDQAGLARCAANSACLLANFAAPAASILVVEPGVPRCGEFISLLRGLLMEQKRFPRSPCPHHNACPMPGGLSRAGKNRWCHFVFETDDAPRPLHTLSAAAGLPKERAALSFLLAGPAAVCPPCGGEEAVRIVSDAFPLPGNRQGRYGCWARGLALAAAEQSVIRNIAPGALIYAGFEKNAVRDPKSGAIVVEPQKRRAKEEEH